MCFRKDLNLTLRPNLNIPKYFLAISVWGYILSRWWRQTDSKMLDCSSIFTWLVARESLIAFYKFVICYTAYGYKCLYSFLINIKDFWRWVFPVTLRRATWYKLTYVSEVLAASIFRATSHLWNAETWVNFYQTIWRSIPEDNFILVAARTWNLATVSSYSHCRHHTHTARSHEFNRVPILVYALNIKTIMWCFKKPQN